MHPHSTTQFNSSSSTRPKHENAYCRDCGCSIGRRSQRCKPCTMKWRHKVGTLGTPEIRRKTSDAAKANRAKGIYDCMFTAEVREKISKATKARAEAGEFKTEVCRRKRSETAKQWYRIHGGHSEQWRTHQSQVMRTRHDQGFYSSPEIIIKQKKGAKKAQANQQLRSLHSANTQRLWANGVYDGVFRSPTTTEVAICVALDALGIEHHSQYRPEKVRLVFDEFIPPNRVIEINGTYWHGDPRFYEAEALNDIQKQAQQRDQYKMIWALEHGYRLSVIWEADIQEMGAEEAIGRALNDGENAGNTIP